MPTVAAVRLRYNPKSYWFDPTDITLNAGEHVLVETERGREIGLVIDPVLEVTDEQISELKSSLKPVVRVLDENDYDRVDELDARGREAMPVFREMIEKNNLDMRPVEIEFLFSGDKATFYYTSENRVDFRELVRDLAAYFHMRIDMRQIGARDEARMVGGLAHCGEVLCCTRIGSEFDSVSIRMAKEQDLSLNPVKISGACGRLMCCLRYEFEAYKDFKQRAPKKGTIVETPLGLAKVTDLDTPREVIQMRLEDGKQLSIPLAELDCEKDNSGCICRCKASREAIDRCASSSIMLALNALDRELEQAEDQLQGEAEPLQVRQQTRRRRRGAGAGGAAGAAGAAGAEAEQDTAAAAAGTKRGARRGDAKRGGESKRGSNAKRGDGTGGADGGAQKSKGKKSKAARGGRGQADRRVQQDTSFNDDVSYDGRKLRRSSRGRQSEKIETNGAQERQQQGQRQDRQQGRQDQERQQEQRQARPRPGQNSSGLRNPRGGSRGNENKQETRASRQNNEAASAAGSEQQGTERTPWRRKRR
ncbi:MAG: hypothetical protein LBB42_01915 [Coriobacteriales bacterium]|jgi:cell fate regulator YaaT (PSP1 superfamily)|nr:hypothetical protein [Coriobacteriales bacterium]